MLNSRVSTVRKGSTDVVSSTVDLNIRPKKNLILPVPKSRVCLDHVHMRDQNLHCV